MRTKSILIFCLLYFFTSLIFGQKELDSLIDAATIKVYDQPNRAIDIGAEIYKDATSTDTKVRALMLISIGYLSQRENEKALEYALRTKEYLDDVANIKTKIHILNAIGMQHQQLRIYDIAIEYLDAALDLTKNLSETDSVANELGYNYAIRGFIYRERMNCDIALTYFNRSIQQYKNTLPNSSSSANLSTMMYNKGNCFLQLTQIDSARTSFLRAIDFAETIQAKSLYSFAKKGLSEVLTLEGNYNSAIQVLNEAEKASKDVGDLLLNQGIYKNLSDNYLAIKDKENYNYYHEKHIQVQKEITEKEQKSIDGSISKLIEAKQQDTKKELARLQGVLLVCIISTIIILFIFGEILLKKRKNLKKLKKNLAVLKK